MISDVPFEFHELTHEEDVFGVEPDKSSLRKPSKATAVKQRRSVSINPSSGLVEIAHYGGYPTYHPPGNTDPWVRTTMKQFLPATYSRIYGFTRRGRGIPGIYEGLMKYNSDVVHHTNLNDYQRVAMKSAIDKARRAFKLPVKYQPLDWHEVGQFMKTDTSAGITFPGMKKRDCMPQIYTESRWLGHRMKQGGKTRFDPRMVRFPPAMAGQRGHMSTTQESKTRLVWVYPSEMLVVEGLYAPVMYRELASLPDGPLLIGQPAHRLYGKWLGSFSDGCKLHGLDFKAFDTGVPPWLIRVAFEILHNNIDWLNWRGKPTTKRSRQKWRNVWDGMVWYFINTPILMPDGRMFRKKHGVPSGSYFTQLVDSVVNYILIMYLAGCQGVNVRNLKVLGDDSIFSSAQVLNLERAQVDSTAVNMNISIDKCDITSDPSEFKVLGTKYRGGHPWREPDEWFKLALYPENVPPDLGVSMSRLVGLWLAGAMWCREFCEFFHYYQSSFEVPTSGLFSKDQKKWLEIAFGGKVSPGWTSKKSMFWRSIFYTL